MKVWRNQGGDVIHVGEWDLMQRPRTAIDDEGCEYIPDPDDMVDENPVPEGATSADEEVVEREDGGLAAAVDYRSLRLAAYPSLKDQLDALWKGGAAAEEMAAEIAAIKARYPKTGDA